MRFCTLLGFLIVASGCEMSPGESPVPVLTDTRQASPILIGTPPGEEVLFKPGGVYMVEEEGDPRFDRARTALGEVTLAVGDLVYAAPDVTAAAEAVDGYLAAYKVEGLPRYAAEQVAAQMVLERFGQKAAEAGGYDRFLRMLVDNGYPSPHLVDAYLNASTDLGETARAELASRALEASRSYEASVAAAERALADRGVDCDRCLREGSGITDEWARAQSSLSRLARGPNS